MKPVLLPYAALPLRWFTPILTIELDAVALQVVRMVKLPVPGSTTVFAAALTEIAQDGAVALSAPAIDAAFGVTSPTFWEASAEKERVSASSIK
jgi:hypothetical protein